MLVSVIMPVYNGEKFIAEAVESILSQTFVNFEFIIINDGSTDNTASILRSYSDKRIYITQRENKGFAFSLNEAISISRGKYLARMDADDIAYEDRLQLQYDFMETHPEVGILGGQADVIDKVGQITGVMRKPTSWANISKYIEYACPICHPTYFVKRAVYELTNGYRKMPPVEDYDFLLRAFEKKIVMANLPEKLIKYRLVSSGMSRGNPQRCVECTFLVQKLHRHRIKKNKEDPIIYSKLSNYKKQTSKWFRFIYHTRNNLLRLKKRQNGILNYFLMIIIICVSLGSNYIFFNTIKGFKSLWYNT